MIKRVTLITIVVALIAFIILLYWSVSSTDEVYSRTTLIDFETMEEIDFRDYDSILVSASTSYKADKIKKLFQGEQYREAWAAQVKIPIVFLDTLKGGMTITKEGGGNQTHSLKLKDSSGVTYTLRSVNKDAKKLIPKFLKTLGLQNIVTDGISAQHPYAALLVAKLADRANVLNTHPKMVFVPKHDQLGKYTSEYGNRLYLFEYESEGDVNWTNIETVTEILDTDDLQELKQEIGDSLIIDQRALVRSRLFDLLIGDWDRHTKQWGWAINKTDSAYVALPIAADRDNAFFNIQGIVPSFLSNKHVVRELRPFKKDIDYLEGLVYPFDRYFLLETDKELFVEEAKKLQQLLSDEFLNDALKVWPKNIADLDGQEIISKMKERRDDMVEYAIKFNAIIKKQGPVNEALKGSEDLELGPDLKGCFNCTR